MPVLHELLSNASQSEAGIRVTKTFFFYLPSPFPTSHGTIHSWLLSTIVAVVYSQLSATLIVWLTGASQANMQVTVAGQVNSFHRVTGPVESGEKYATDNKSLKSK